jgi:ADP-heptose:LPS heptosyltransferase
MYLLYAPPKKFGTLPDGAAPITPEVKFFSNVAYCPKFYWNKQHTLHGFFDLSPRWMVRLRKKRTLYKILFIVTGGFGDVMWTMPVIRQVRALYPRSRISVATTPRVLPVFENFPFADTFVPNDFNILQNLVPQSDEVYDFGGIATILKKEMKKEPVDACFYHAGIDPPRDPSLMLPHLVLTLQEGKNAETLLSRHGIDTAHDIIITLSAESSTSNRNYPSSYLYDLAQALAKDGFKVIILSEYGNYRDHTSQRCKCGFEFSFNTKSPPKALSFQCPVCKSYALINDFGPPDGILDLSGITNYRTALAVIALSNCFVGPASSLVIASTALGVPTLGLYGAFNPKRLQKYYRKFDSLYANIDCSPCSEHWTECRFGYPSPCMKALFPSMLYDRIRILLETYPRESLSRQPFE